MRNSGRCSSPRLTLRRNARCEMRIIAQVPAMLMPARSIDDVKGVLRDEGVEQDAEQTQRRGDDDAAVGDVVC